jgi:HK97 family phage portal protein
MSIISKILKREESTEPETATETTTELNNDSPQDLLLKSLLRGEKITKEKAMSVPAISSAVDRISNSIAILPIRMYKHVKDKDGIEKVEEINNDSRLKILNYETGDLLNPFDLKKAIARDYLIEKGAYIFIEKNKNEFKSLRYVEPENVSFQSNYDPIFKDVKYNVNGQDYEKYNFLTVLRNTKDGFKGKSAIEEISESIETAFTTIMYELGLVKKGGAKKGFLTATRKLGKEEIKLLKQAWNEYYGGNNEENVIILNDGIEFKEGANSSVELQMNERKRTLKEDINDVFHIYSDYNSTIKDAVMPIISAIETALNNNFLLESEKAKVYFAFDTKKITRGSLKERYEAYKIASDTGWMTKNEIRYAEDYDSIEGLDVVSMNLANVLYDVKNKTYYTPNTGSVMNMNKGGETDENTSKE